MVVKGKFVEMSDVQAHRLTLHDVDPTIATKVREKIAQVRTSISNGSDITRALVRQRAYAQQAGVQEGAPPLVTLQMYDRADIAILAQIKSEGRAPIRRASQIAGWACGPLLIGALILFDLTAGQIVFGSAVAILFALLPAITSKRLCSDPSAATLAAVLPIVAKTQAEQEYIIASVEIFAAQDVLGASEARALLASLNSLLESARALTLERKSIDRAAGANSRLALEDERLNILSRLDSMTDAVARGIFAESLAMCDMRINQAKELEPVRERIEAQLESIRQAMRSLQMSLARLAIADVDSVARDANSVSQNALHVSTQGLQNRARAVEQAVQEVATLRSR